jgi:hypothetical protein
MNKQGRELIRLRERIASHLQDREEETIDNPDTYRFITSRNLPPDWRKFPKHVSLTLQTYHRVAEVMERLNCGFSEAIEAMLCDVEACKVQPVHKQWKKKYRKHSLWQSLDLQKVLRIKKTKP